MEIRGYIIIVRFKKSRKITTDTTLSSFCERYGISYQKIRRRKFPFWLDTENESYHFQKLKVRDQVDVDDFRNRREK